MKSIKIGNREIGPGKPLYFIADIAANHDGDIQRAFKLIELAKEAGADAAKFQNFKAKSIVSKKGFEDLKGQLSHQATWKKSVYEVYEDASVSYDWTSKLKAKCDEVGIDYFTSPYDFESVDHVDPYVEVYKIGSGDITWLDIVAHIAKKDKPVMIAAGASSMTDVVRAMNTLESYTNEIVLMQCNTNYTASGENYKYINLNVLKAFRSRFPETILGLSDHTHGHATVLGAIALGALVFEKHFTDDNSREGPDHKFAMNPAAWREMVDRSIELHYALGDGVKVVEKNEKQSVVLQRRSIRATKSMNAGTVLTAEDIEVLRPCPEDAFPPYKAHLLLGKRLTNSINTGEHFTKKHFD